MDETGLMRALAPVGFLGVLLLLGGCGGEPSRPVEAVSSMVPLCGQDPEALALHVPSPDWREEIIYMLMIDRFNDGDASNNDQGAGEYDRFKETHFTGGDLPGIIDKLDYLEALGVTAIWITPPVYNQWWSQEYTAAGWHGYWPTHFSKVDPHFGTLNDYQRLSHGLHCRGMHLIQDIIVNHVGNFYNYRGDYDPEDTAKGFFLIEEGHPTQEGPSQWPFSMINRLDPEHAAAGIYHWTPPVFDFRSRHQELNYGLGTVADINTENPLVIDTFKRIYREWIEKVGVDGFRIDTVMLVPPAFFKRFLHDEDGIYAGARALGKEDFITFGEVIGISKPYETSGERKVGMYMGEDGRPGINSMLGYPLYFSISEVLADGRPTAELAYRLDAFMREFPDPYRIPTFIDNHDTTRFLTAGSQAAFKQALALLMTIPGVPILLQGTEQALRETRQTMFGPAYGSKEDNFKPDSEPYRYLQTLTGLRKSSPVFTRGSMTQLASSATGKGLLAFKREHEGETALVLLNTASHRIYADGIETGLPPWLKLITLFSLSFDGELVTGADGRLSLELPGRALVVASVKGAEALPAVKQPAGPEFSLNFTTQVAETAYTSDIVLAGEVSLPGADLQLVLDGNLDQPQGFRADARGRWQTAIPVRDLGEHTRTFQIYAPQRGYLSPAQTYRTRVDQPEYVLAQEDPADDARGLSGKYLPPQHRDADRQLEIVGMEVRGAGAVMELTLSMQKVTDIWLPPNGFDNVVFTLFIDLPGRQGVRDLPLLNAQMPEGLDWDIGHFASGWDSFAFAAHGSTAEHRGDILPNAPAIATDKAARTVTLVYNGNPWGVADWRGARIYVTTWDASGEATYRPILAEPSAWLFSGGAPDDPKIMDELLFAP